MNSTTSKEQIQFIQNHQTALDAGEYKITITQNIIGKDNQGLAFTDEFKSHLDFVIQGSRFSLQPQDIHAVFPPENSFGDHSNALPHIALKSSTLPWERPVYLNAPPDSPFPWLALLVLHESEKPLRTIQKENFFNAKFSDQQGRETIDKEKLWQCLLSDAVSWLRLIENDEAIIVEKEARKILSLTDDFAIFDSQVEALLYEGEKLLRTIQKEDFFNAKFYDRQEKAIPIETKKKLWQYLLSDAVSWLRLNDEAIIVEKEARKIPSLTGDFAIFDSQVEALLAQVRDIKLVTLKKLEIHSKSHIKWSGTKLETGQEKKDKIAVIDIPKMLLSEILPTAQELQYLAHVRQTTPEISLISQTKIEELPKRGNQNIILANVNGSYYVRIFNAMGETAVDRAVEFDSDLQQKIEKALKDEKLEDSTKIKIIQSLESHLGYKPSEPLSIVVSNRLPKKDGTSTAYLVSLENRCLIKVLEKKDRIAESLTSDAEGNNFESTNNEIKEFLKGKEGKEVKMEDLLDLPAVKKLEEKIQADLWSYLFSPEVRWIEAVFDDQNATDQDYIRLVVLKSWIFTCSKPEQDFKGLLKKLGVDTLQLPKLNNDADRYLSQGYVALPHYLRQGGKTFSWYHSPLLPGKNPTSPELSQLAVRCADQLIAYDESNGLFDISYAAAWQLGQLLALQDKKLAINLFNWKRANAQKLAKDNQQSLYPYLFASDSPKASDSISLPEEINMWLNQLALLSGVPFNYLVPDDKMLPSESIRFFCLDWFWVESLLDGAFSIGRVHETNPQLDTLPKQVKQITGCLIRSEVIAGWPDLQIDASASSIEESKSMEENQKLKLLRRDRLSQDVLICLFEGEIKTLDISLKPEGLHFGFNVSDDSLSRELRESDGTEQSSWKITQIPWKNQKQRVVNIDKLALEIKNKLTEETEKKEKKKPVGKFTSAQFALQMVQGADLVRWIKNAD